MFVLFLLFSVLLYFAAVTSIARNFIKLPLPPINTIEPNQTFSIIIPFRNELIHLPGLLNSLSRLDYPLNLFEIIFIDDHSDDLGAEWFSANPDFKSLPIRYIALPNDLKGKKHAIEAGVNSAQFDNIFTTDADCTIPPAILKIYGSLLENPKLKLIAGPVLYEENSDKSFVSDYQIIENAGLIAMGAWGFAAGRPFMANGANLCYRKSCFTEVQAYNDNIQIPGGDDEFLVRKVHSRYPDGTMFCKHPETLVKTTVQPDFKGLINQRIRWAGKAKINKNKMVFIIQIWLFLFYLSLVLGTFVAIITPALFPIITLSWTVKILTDIYFYSKISGFFNLRYSYLKIAMAGIFQVCFIPLIALLSLNNRFEWKNRKYS